MASFFDAKASLGDTKRILAVLFVVGFVVGFLLTPLGFETRENEIRTLWFAVFFVTVGLLLPIAGLVSSVAKTKSRWRLGGNRRCTNFLNRARRSSKVFLHSCPSTCRYSRRVHSHLTGNRIYAERTTNIYRKPTK